MRPLRRLRAVAGRDPSDQNEGSGGSNQGGKRTRLDHQARCAPRLAKLVIKLVIKLAHPPRSPRGNRGPAAGETLRRLRLRPTRPTRRLKKNS